MWFNWDQNRYILSGSDLRKISSLVSTKGVARIQIGALCYRFTKGRPEYLLITSRGTGRWIVPKGWPIDDKSPPEAVAEEAWEEAGVKGTVKDKCIGAFGYTKIVAGDQDFPCQVLLFPLKVKSLAQDYRESAERRRKWFRPKKAAARVSDPELAKLLRGLDPATLL